METIKVQLLGRPASYIRAQLNTGKALTPQIEEEFEKLRKDKEELFVQQDLKKEQKNQKNREIRMKKLHDKLDEKKSREKRDGLSQDEDSKQNIEQNV